MHERAAVQTALDAAIATAERNHATRVTALDVVVAGETVHDDAVRQYLEVLGAGTLAEGATVRLRREPVESVCWSCGARTQGDRRCGACGSRSVQQVKTTACRIESIEIEEA